jgi:hypothetical protein
MIFSTGSGMWRAQGINVNTIIIIISFLVDTPVNIDHTGNTEGGNITELLASCLTGL